MCKLEASNECRRYFRRTHAGVKDIGLFVWQVGEQFLTALHAVKVKHELQAFTIDCPYGRLISAFTPSDLSHKRIGVGPM